MCASDVFAGIENVTVVPTGTDFFAGKKRKIVESDPVVAGAIALPAGPANLLSIFCSLTTFSYSFLAAFSFAFMEGIALALATP